MTLYTVYISVGSNVAPEDHIKQGLNQLHEYGTLIVSPVYETAPINADDAPNYWNLAVIWSVDMPIDQIKPTLKQIEVACGRMRRNPDGTKNHHVTLDLDLLMIMPPHDDWPADESITRYAFVARPLADIAPDVMYPPTGETIRQIADRLGDAGLSRLDVQFT